MSRARDQVAHRPSRRRSGIPQRLPAGACCVTCGSPAGAVWRPPGGAAAIVCRRHLAVALDVDAIVVAARARTAGSLLGGSVANRRPRCAPSG